LHNPALFIQRTRRATLPFRNGTFAYRRACVAAPSSGTRRACLQGMKDILENLLSLQKLDLRSERVTAVGAGPDALRKKIPAQVLQHYDRLRSRNKKGVAFVRHGVCGQCHMQVAVGTLALLRRQDNLYRCENCGAYLYLTEETEPMAMPP